jgi:hypothetical protein
MTRKATETNNRTKPARVKKKGDGIATVLDKAHRHTQKPLTLHDE